MTQEEKDLLLKDLCARLPYGVKVQDIYYNSLEPAPIWLIDINAQDVRMFADEGYQSIEYIKPYLFPLSSLTEEQRNDISKLLIDTQNTFSPYGKINTKGCDNLFVCSVKQANAFINYCLMHHLDINGLIEKRLAIDATGLNIY